MNNDATEAALGLLGLSPLNAPPPIVPLKRKQSNTTLTVPDDSHSSSSDAIHCICGFVYDDGFSIACDDCSRWCHAACFDIVEGEVPEEWRCWVCIPRPVDRERAIKSQKARQKQALEAQEKQKRRPSPGVERKQRRASAAAIEGSNSKRKRRSSISVHQTAEDEHVDIDEPWALSYVPITKDITTHQETNAKLRRQAQHWRGVTALGPNTTLSPHESTPIRLPDNTLPLPSQTTIQPLPNSTYSHPTLSSNTNPSVRPPSYAMHTTMPISSSHLITPYTSTIIPSSVYLSDPLNAYAHLGMPKPFVHLFGPPLDVTLDSRITGDKSRFVRSGCRPNAVLRPVLCPQAKDGSHVRQDHKGDEGESDEETLSFGVFALRDLKANEEVVLGWEWDDGNAVHSLPALIESPHIFPTMPLTLCPESCCSPSQLAHLRHQMTSILHALSSTFTTCACGSKAKDCALNQMAAFVDGEIPIASPVSARDEKGCEGKKKEKQNADLGPLVGAKRGFKTREKIPMSSGMSGVEMIPPEESTTPTPTSSFTPQPGPSKLPDMNTNDHQAPLLSPPRKKLSLPVLTLSPATASPSPRKRKDRKGKGRAMVDGVSDGEQTEALPHGEGRTPLFEHHKTRSRGQVVIDTSPASSPGPSSHNYGTTMDIDDDTTPDFQPEEKLPPKMRKRWIHSNSDTFREWRSPGSPSGSMVSSGSASGFTPGEADSDKMDVDHLDPKQMPPPPMPAALDPTTISSVESRVAPSYCDASSVSQTSPSSNFSKLTLFSPIAPGSAIFPISSLPSYQSHLSSPPPTPSMSRPSPPSRLNGNCIERPEEMSPESCSTHAPSPSDAHRVRFASPEVLNVMPPPTLDASSERHNHPAVPGPELPSDADGSPKSKIDEDVNMDTSHPEDLPDNKSSVHDDSNQDQDRTTPTPSSPPPVKVKMSLRDFALRKKKQREEEMAKTLSSPVATPTTSALSSSPSPKLASKELEPEDASSAQHDPPGLGNFSERGEMSNGVNEKDSTQQPVGVDALYIQHPRETSHPVPDGQVPKSNGNPVGSLSLQAKVEAIEELVPRGLVASDDGIHHLLTFAPEPPPPPLNGHARKGECDTNSTFLPTPPSGGIESAPLTRRPSHEDGEIPSTTPPKAYFFPRSHTPPTQPRSFHVPPPSSPGLPPSSASSVSRRPPLPPLSRSQISNSLPPNLSRPVPSGPRALRAGSLSSHLPVYTPNRSFSGSQYIPRGPSADRDRIDWERERGWPGSARIRGRGGGAGWNR